VRTLQHKTQVISVGRLLFAELLAKPKET